MDIAASRRYSVEIAACVYETLLRYPDVFVRCCEIFCQALSAKIQKSLQNLDQQAADICISESFKPFCESWKHLVIFLNLFAWLEGVSTASQAYAEWQRISQRDVDVRAQFSAVALYDLRRQIDTDKPLQLRPKAKARIMQVISESPIQLLVLFGAEAPEGQLKIASPESGISTSSAPTTPKTPRDTSPLSSGRLGSKRPPPFTTGGTSKRTKMSKDSSSSEDASQPYLSCVASGPEAQYNPTPTNTLSLSPDMTLAEARSDTETIIAETTATVKHVGKKPEKETTIPRDKELRALTLKTNTPKLSVETSQERNSASVFGKLTTVADSIWTATIDLEARLTTFGRDTNCTYVYPDPMDVRVPKNPLYVLFWRPGIESAINRGEDWTLMNDLYALVVTNATYGIHVNGVPLPKGLDSEAWKYGKLYNGDIISVCEDKVKGWSLQFMCEFSIGFSKKPRKDVFVVETEMEKWVENEARKLEAKLGEQSGGEASSKGSLSLKGSHLLRGFL